MPTVVGELKDLGSDGFGVTGSVAESDKIYALTDVAPKQCGRIDILANDSGELADDGRKKPNRVYFI